MCDVTSRRHDNRCLGTWLNTGPYYGAWGKSRRGTWIKFSCNSALCHGPSDVFTFVLWIPVKSAKLRLWVNNRLACANSLVGCRSALSFQHWWLSGFLPRVGCNTVILKVKKARTFETSEKTAVWESVKPSLSNMRRDKSKRRYYILFLNAPVKLWRFWSDSSQYATAF